MNKIYKAKNLYVLRLARVTEVKTSSIYSRESGYTKSRPLPKYHMAKLVKTTDKSSSVYKANHFKLIRGGAVFHDNHELTTKGDIYVIEKTPVSLYLTKPVTFIKEKTLLEFEDELNSEEDDVKTEENSASSQEKTAKTEEKSMSK